MYLGPIHAGDTFLIDGKEYAAWDTFGPLIELRRYDPDLFRDPPEIKHVAPRHLRTYKRQGNNTGSVIDPGIIAPPISKAARMGAAHDPDHPAPGGLRRRSASRISTAEADSLTPTGRAISDVARPRRQRR